MFSTLIHRVFGKSAAKKSLRKAGKVPHRRLSFESLESRELLSVTPLFEYTYDDVSSASCVGCAPYDSSHDPNFMVAAASIDIAAAPPFSLAQTFKLHSNPGANHTIYLDFNGHTTTETQWNKEYNDDKPIVTLAYNFEGPSSSFSNNELERIQYIWQRVSEDFAPFNVNVTTEEPSLDRLIKTDSSDNAWGIRVVIGASDHDWYPNVGGTAVIGSFNRNADLPCFVFSNKLSNGNEKHVAEAITHEVGHTLGLTHDGNTVQEYDMGANGWAPIMGSAYFQPLTQWSKGEYTNANNKEDDLAIITGAIKNFYTTPHGGNGFGYRADDHGNTIATAAVLTSVNSTFAATGIVERNTDVDMFRFTLAASSFVSFDIVPGTRDANLDVLAKILDATGKVVAISNLENTLSASFKDMLLEQGVYYVSVEGTGRTDIYSDYGSIGFYTVSGNHTRAPDKPNSRITATTDSSVTLTWFAVDKAVGYEVQLRTAGGVFETWTGKLVTGTTATITGLASATGYEFRIRTLTASAYSFWSSISATTKPSVPANFRITDSTENYATLAWDAVPRATGYILYSRPKDSGFGWVGNILSKDTLS